jgi:formate dehydrogenase maturation protein FdhE
MNKNIKPISSRRYINNFDAGVCPVCQSSDISSDSVDMDGSIGTANVECKTCESYWTDIVHVTSYSNLNEGMDPFKLDVVLEKAKAELEHSNG